MNREREIRRIISMLNTIAKTAERASSDGTFSEGRKIAIRQYNNTLRKLIEMGEIPEGFFPELSEEASFDEVGVACKQLVSYLEGGIESDTVREIKDSIDNIVRETKDIAKETVRDVLKEVKVIIKDLSKSRAEKGDRERKG